MAERTLALVHTLTGVVSLFDGLAQELLPGVRRFHIVDEGMLKVVLAEGGPTPALNRRLCEHAVWAESAGADVILVTCNSISPCVDVAQQVVRVPVVKIDQAMADRALEMGRRIGVVATAPTALKPVSDLVRGRARAKGVEGVEVEAVLCEGAYAALFAGDLATHDRLVQECLEQLMARNEVVLLAQASMARALEGMPAERRRAPVLTSPRLGMEYVRQVLESLG
jgi:hypothetical protein